jgi:hypothetical protein
MVTEEEARKRICPIGQIALQIYSDKGTFTPALCQGSCCMMWREELARDEAENGFHAASGYCGLGGKP